MIIAVDFDDTCVVNRFPEIGEEMPGCVETLKFLIDKGHKIVLWTCRENVPKDDLGFPGGPYLDDAVEWFNKHDIKLCDVNHYYVEDAPWFATRKIVADIFIDDRNFGGFPGWDVIRNYFEKLGTVS